MADRGSPRDRHFSELESLRKRLAALEHTAAELAIAEAACSDAEERYSQLFEGSRDAIYVAGPEGEIIEANASALALLGYDRAEILGLDIWTLYADQAAADEFRRRLGEDGFTSDHEGRLRRKDGAEIDCLITANVRRSNGGRPRGHQGIIRDITTRKATQEALRQSEERFRTLAESIGEGMAAVDTDERFVFVNRAATELFGVERDELLGRSLRDFVSDEEWRTVLNQSARRKKGEVGRYELEIHRPDGVTRNIVVTATPQLDDAGRHVGAAAILADVTERKQAERALHESEERYRSLFEKSQDVIYITSRDGRLIDISPSAESLFGYRREELIGMDVRTLYADGGDRRRFQAQIEQGESVRGFEVRFLNRDGETLDCLLTSTVRRALDGSLLGYQGIIRDVTEQRRIERKSERERGALRIIADAAVRATDVPDLCTRALSGLIETLGFDFGTMRLYDDDQRVLTPVAVVGMADEDARRIAPQSIDDPTTTAAVVAQTGEAILAPDVATHGIQETHGTRLRKFGIRAIIVWPIFGTHENLLGVVQLCARRPKEIRDEEGIFFQTMSEMLAAVLERRRAVDEKEHMRVQLLQAQKMEAVGTLAAGVAHDFNNLLTAIQGFADLAMSSLDDSHPVRADLEKIRSSAERGARLVRQLLVFSRKQPIELVPLNLNGTTEALSRMVAPLIGEDVAMNLVLEKGLWPAMADEGSIQQVLMNLAVNARDAMPDGGTLTIKTGNVSLDEAQSAGAPGSRPGRFVCLSVQDTGAGMNEETRARIFEPFFSTKSPAKGTGLGLAVVYGIVRQHAGWIDVESAPAAGTTFRVHVPATHEEPRSDKEVARSSEDLAGNGERVLVVEDENTVRDFAAKVLRRNGYVVFEAESVSQALGLFERESGRFDLIFSDVVLPDTSGVHLVERLLEDNPDLNVLLSSGHADVTAQWSAIRERGIPFLQKPYSLPDLLRTVKEIVRPS